MRLKIHMHFLNRQQYLVTNRVAACKKSDVGKLFLHLVKSQFSPNKITLIFSDNNIIHHYIKNALKRVLN